MRTPRRCRASSTPDARRTRGPLDPGSSMLAAAWAEVSTSASVAGMPNPWSLATFSATVGAELLVMNTTRLPAARSSATALAAPAIGVSASHRTPSRSSTQVIAARHYGVPRFEPFTGLRYAADLPLDDLISPPYDVIDDDERMRLEARSRYNSVHVELPRPRVRSTAYAAARSLLDQWRATGCWSRTTRPRSTGTAWSSPTSTGARAHTTGVLGALELSKPGEGDVLPHERTMPKPKDDRLDLLRAARPTVAGVGSLHGTRPGQADCRRHRAARRRGRRRRRPPPPVAGHRRRTACERSARPWPAAPVVIADGHHRYRDGTGVPRRASGRHRRPSRRLDFLMALHRRAGRRRADRRAIHRLVDGLPGGFDVLAALQPFFEPTHRSASHARGSGAALGLVTPDGVWMLEPRPDTDARPTHDLDSSRLDVALAAFPEHELTYQHGRDLVAAAVDKGGAQRGGPAPPGDGGPDRRDGPHPHPDAGQDDVLLPEAADRARLPRGVGLSLRADLYDWECRHVAGRGLQDLEFYARLAGITGGPILELGCGTGRLTKPLAALGFDVVGLDNDPDMLEWAAPRVTLVEADMRDFDLGSPVPARHRAVQQPPVIGRPSHVLPVHRAASRGGGLLGVEVTDFLVDMTEPISPVEPLGAAEGIVLFGALDVGTLDRTSWYQRRFVFEDGRPDVREMVVLHEVGEQELGMLAEDIELEVVESERAGRRLSWVAQKPSATVSER